MSLHLCIVPASAADVQVQRAVGIKVVERLLHQAAPSPTVWIHCSLKEHKQEDMSEHELLKGKEETLCVVSMFRL